MVTTDLIKGAFEAIVTALNVRVAFIPVWVKPLDEDTELRYPAVWWGPLSSPISKKKGLSAEVGFSIDIMFLEQTDPNRSPNELLQAHSRMHAIGLICFLKFCQLYVDNAGSFQGVDLDMNVTEAILLPVYDDGPKQLTGVNLKMTVVASGLETCLDNYFT